ncbi:MAG: glutamate synthase subunit alpha, partial [Firmicutes bacterium]|nr:glutamate synthase subunit alpha [Bacillota bacterium]
MRVCSMDTCPMGIATQNEELRKHFRGRPEYVMNFMLFIAEELREIMASLGFRTVDEMVGRTDCLKLKDKQITKRAEMVDLTQILNRDHSNAKGRHFDPGHIYDFRLENTADEKVLLPAFEKYIKSGEKHCAKLAVSSTDRTLGTITGSVITEKLGPGLEDDTYVVDCVGGAGQSFGAFIPKGLTLRLEGDANDGLGKGLSGGKIIVVPPKSAKFKASENMIIGNVALYGATSGKAYICGIAGERFCVRNSGAAAVAEGCGDHGLEYMTGGRAVILGTVGKNFAAGMSGGIAYVLDKDHDLYKKINKEMVSSEELSEKYDIEELKEILEDYVKETGSELGTQILENFSEYLPHFKKIVPHDYKKILSAIGRFEEQGIPHDKAVLEAFDEITGSGKESV